MRRDRSDNSGWGGCLIYYKNGLPIVRETHLEPKKHELMIFTIQTSSGILLLSLAYCPPKKARSTIDWYDKHLDDLISKTKANICVLTGDFTVTTANGCPASPPLMLKGGKPTTFAVLMISLRL